MVHRVFLSLVGMLAAFLQLALWPTGCNPASTISEESSFLESVGPVEELSAPEAEYLLIPPSPPVMSGLISCEEVLSKGCVEWAMEIPPGLYEAADSILFDQFGLYEGSLQFMGMEESQHVFVANEISPHGLEFGEGWVSYYLSGKKRYVVRFCDAYWEMYQDGRQVYAMRIATPPWAD